MTIPKLLLLETNDTLREAFQKVLLGEIAVVSVSTPEEAVSCFTQDFYAVVVVGPGMNPLEAIAFLETVKNRAPDTLQIMLMEHLDTETMIDAVNRGSIYRVVVLPWRVEELRGMIQAAISKYAASAETTRRYVMSVQQNVELKDIQRTLEKELDEQLQEVSRLHRQMQQSFLGAVRALARLTEMYSPVIGSHSKRVSSLSREIGGRMGLSEGDLFQLEVAATLHDIGQVIVPSEILNKTENILTYREREVLRSHVLHGEAILQAIPNMVEAARIVRCHHERLNGTGYPDGLKGLDIPVGSRIIAAIDAYDKALNSRAIFESATSEKALHFVMSRSPSWFDREVVGLLEMILNEGKRWGDDASEVEVHMNDLQEGMVLSRDLVTSRGVLLLSKNSEIQKRHLHHLLNHLEIDPFIESIYVYRKKTPAESSS